MHLIHFLSGCVANGIKEDSGGRYFEVAVRPFEQFVSQFFFNSLGGQSMNNVPTPDSLIA